ncbi:MAG: restriction endonuclease subunit S [Peptostreptococcaceae bacterium]
MKSIEFERYPEYKRCQLELFEKMPSHWEMLANKYIFKLKKTQVGKRSNEYDLLSLTLKGIIKRDMENPEGKFPADFDTYQEVKKGDFVFCLFDVEETPRTVGVSNYNGMITGAYTVLEASDKFDKKYLYYFYLNLDLKKRLKMLYKGLRNTISKDSFFSFKTFIPPLNEQIAIAKFLDEKCNKIDKAIAQKEKLIELLNERKQIIIQNAVTKGLNPDAEMKESGFKWIGAVPKNWQILRLKYLLNEINKRTTTGQEELLSLSKYQGIIPKSLLAERAGQAESLIGYKLVCKNQLVINKMQAVNGLLAVSKINGITSPDYSVYESKKTNILKIEYLGHLLKQTEYLAEFKKRVTGVMEGFIRLYTDDLFQIYIQLPPIEEQERIVSYIEEESKKIDNAVSLQEKQIQKLKEYREILIDNAVTGKIKVGD